MTNQLSANDELFNSFLMWATNANSWNDEGSYVWTRSSTLNEWDIQVLPTNDPYELLPHCVAATPQASPIEMMLLMYGWATPYDENNPDEMNMEERRRVRVVVYFHDGKERMGVQFQGSTIEEMPTDGGMFADTLRGLRLAQSLGN